MEINTSRILAQNCLIPNNTRLTHINNNDLIIGPSGAGKTRNYVKPNLLQCALQGGESLVVADTKGSLIREVGPVLAAHGCRVVNLDLTDLLNNTTGYNPLDHVRYDPVQKKYSEQDILTLASCLIPIECAKDPFWEQSAQLYLAALIGYALEALPQEEHSLESVCRLYQAMEDENFDKLFQELEEENPHSFAASTYRMVAGGKEAYRTYASIKMFLVKNLLPLSFDGPRHLYSLKERIDFRALGREQTAVFLTISDTDRSMDKIANIFYTQALHTLIESADKDYRPDSRLPVPVRLILDDFATNAVIPDFDGIISIIRSREVYVSLIIQSINQLYGLYGDDKGKTIINNCDNCLYLGGQDVDTSRFISIKANRTQDTILSMPLDGVWLFTRGQKPRQVRKYDLTAHPLYGELPEAKGEPAPEPASDLAPAQAPVPAEEDPPLPPAAELEGLFPAPSAPEPIHTTEQQLLSLEGRKRILAEKTARLETLLAGRRVPTLSGLLNREDSEENVHALTGRLLEHARFCSRTRGRGELTERERVCLRCFFYCTLRLSARPPVWNGWFTGSVQDVLTAAGQMDYADKAGLHFEELYVAGGAGGFWGWMDELYELFTGLPITSRISAAEEQLVRDSYWDVIAAADSSGHSDEDFDWEDWEQDAEEWRMEAEYARERQRREDWAKEFPEPRRLCQSYMLLRRLFFDTELPDTLPRLVEQALDSFLQEQGLGCLLQGEAFSSACKLLDGAAEQLERLLAPHISE